MNHGIQPVDQWFQSVLGVRKTGGKQGVPGYSRAAVLNAAAIERGALAANRTKSFF